MTATLLAPPVLGDRRKNTSAWAAYNRRRWWFEKDVLGVDERAPFVCECASATCLSGVELTMMEYEAAHMCPSWRAIVPEHVTVGDAIEVIVRHPHFWVSSSAGCAGGDRQSRSSSRTWCCSSVRSSHGSC